uniref:Uncharacterized protein n=1 Tax=Neolamprologus brichardi TaxID=32507 RepID=A0A3Q4GRC6_NEOBR
MSKTLIINCEVPDFGGVPPSTAVSVSLITDCFSRSKGFWRTSSADTLSPLFTANEKCSFALNLYILMPFFPTSESKADNTRNLVPGNVLSAISILCESVLKAG